MGFETLIYSIFRQTFEDYNSLIESGKTFATSHTTEVKQSKYRVTPKYSIAEIQDFLRSGWCNTLLSIIEKDEDKTMRQMINTVLTGKETVSMDVVIEYHNKAQPLSKWASELGFTYKALYDRLALGWSVEDAFTTPVRKRRCVI